MARKAKEDTKKAAPVDGEEYLQDLACPKVQAPQVKVSFKDDEMDLWEMVKQHSCKAGFIKDTLKYYRDHNENPQPPSPPPLSPGMFSGVI